MTLSGICFIEEQQLAWMQSGVGRLWTDIEDSRATLGGAGSDERLGGMVTLSDISFVEQQQVTSDIGRPGPMLRTVERRRVMQVTMRDWRQSDVAVALVG